MAKPEPLPAALINDVLMRTRPDGDAMEASKIWH